MDGSRLLVDTNIILYALKGDNALTDLIDGQELFISFVTRIELLSFPKIDAAGIELIERFLQQVPVVESSPVINADAIYLRRKSGLEVPDAIIAASARFLGVRLMTADKDFKKVEEELDLLLYTK
ncbi:MAG: type II toxin-antitoxin system VapC family toxin [Bacteroidetes bacterium]|nr:type II toxin-antitoxin system VapC family toxin [Bacteroidota bacterium]MBX7128318.1 type II toxin-antitoxin system VapC family toxin [Flavobacteriales bacterium]MCC6654999.1 type II toxin-antitoxin system VapC family toxin [Flavobacteriales bacterium]HMU13733.1 type II toxin-antitoxin system VapC family toxin [Flavobacteriales bacterium]HMZ47862.1 type II toxin-antitoxin system VapC family toxin [Flavobacteriales bacterium]